MAGKPQGRSDIAQRDARPRVYRDLIIDKAGEDTILLHPYEARWALTNDTGVWFAQRLDGTRTLQEAAEELATALGDTLAESIYEDLREFVQQLYEAGLLESHPLPPPPPKEKLPDLTLYLTEECNLRCKHCAVVEGKMPQTTITREDAIRVIDEHASLNPGTPISFTGGEPLLHPSCLDIVEYATGKTDYVNLATNGLLIGEEEAARLAALNVWVQISLDGADPEVHDFIRGKGSFEKAWGAVESLCRHGGRRKVLIATTLTRCVLDQVKELIDRVDRTGIRKLRLLTLNKLKAAVTNWERIAPDAREMLDIYRYLLLELPLEDRTGKPAISASFPGFVPDTEPSGQPWCPLGRTHIVDSQGVTYNCPTLRGEHFATGNVHQTSLRQIQEGERNSQLREEMLRRRYTIEECTVCPWRNFCQGGCEAFTSLRTGSLWVNDEFCDFRRELYRETALRQARMKSGA